MNKNSTARTVAFLGVTLALVFVFLLIETYAFSAFFGNFTPAALTIPLAIAVAVTGKKWRMFVGGTLLGVSSFILAIIISNPIFLNPLISVLPRVIIGIVAYFICVLSKNLFKNAQSNFVKNVLPYSLAGIFGVLTNTVLVSIMLWVFNYQALAAVYTLIISVNFVGEIIAAAILVPIFATLINKIERN